MKAFLTILLLLQLGVGFAQKSKTDLAKKMSSPDRKAIVEVLKQKLQPDLKLLPKLVVKELWVKNGFAYFIGQVKGEHGKAIDFTKTVYKDEVKAGIFDGDGTNALLKKTGGKWKVLAYAIGPTDVPWGCWWKEFKAPKEIFDYAEKTCN
ncbi:MAG: hypothetical protein EOO10_09315 [Chitinophagaceae bacterium]|nr:MAG: hypothetical protein EOO10_09315 [Chitinophagaceae bacterium]